MNKKRIIRKVILGVFVISSLHLTADMKAEAAVIKNEMVNADFGNEQARTEKLVWYYKEENGKRYMRLYDASNKVWLTDWIPCD